MEAARVAVLLHAEESLERPAAATGAPLAEPPPDEGPGPLGGVSFHLREAIVAPVTEDQIAVLRREYEAAGLVEDAMAADPFTQFDSWFEGVAAAGLEEPNAFVLATASADGRPSARAVLMKDLNSEGLAFYTNLESAKSRDLKENPRAAATFVWVPLHRQVRFEGYVTPIPAAQADAYFASRPVGAQIGAYASIQSRPVHSRAALDERFDRKAVELGSGPVPRPEWWGGWVLRPESVEFWQGQPNRLHDRIVYRRAVEGAWIMERLAP